MASQMSEPAGPVPVPVPPKKKARLNPARRKAAQGKTGIQDAVPKPVSSSTGISLSKPTSTAGSLQVGRKAEVLPAVRKANTGPDKTLNTGKQIAKSKPKPTSNPCPPLIGNDTKASESKAGALALATPALVTGGLVGCAAGAAVLLGAGLFKNFAGVDSAILVARTAKLCMDNLIEEIISSMKAGTYSAPEALDTLRRTTLAYASIIPGGAAFVERLFREIDQVRRQRGREVDAVVAETYSELTKAGSRGAGPVEMQSIVLTNLVKLSKFAENATQDVLARNPDLRPYREEVARALRRPPEPKVPTVKLNMAVKHKRAIAT